MCATDGLPGLDIKDILVDLLMLLGYTVCMNNKEQANIMNTVTLALTAEQARAVSAAINAEIIKGESTFLSSREVLDLGKTLDQIRAQTTANKASLMSRIEAAVEDYMDACDYSNYRDLTVEDIDYLAGELQIATQELRDLLNLELV